jgi:hypothetical protein
MLDPEGNAADVKGTGEGAGLKQERILLYEFFPQPTSNHLLGGPKEWVS